MVLHFLLNLLIYFYPYFYYLVNYLLNPLLLDLDAYLILSLNFPDPSSCSSSISPPCVLFPLISANDLLLLLFLILYSTNEASSPFSSNIYLTSDIDLFLEYAVLRLLSACSYLNACFFLFIY